MKYWSSSRVGAVPQQGTSNKPKDRGSRYGRKKGITMEDLKKQTALRLAQEQKHHQQKLGADGGGPTYNQRNPLTPGTAAHAASPAAALGVVRGHPPSRSGLSRSKSDHAAYGGGGSNNNNNRGGMAPPPAHHHQHHYGASENVRPSPHHYDPAYRPPPPTSMVVVAAPVDLPQVPPMSSAMFSGDSSHSHRRPRPLAAHSSSSFDSSSQQHPNKAKSKLPHGLTVSELKEMTKARLQAEASVPDKDSVSISPAPPAAPGMIEYRDRVPEGVSPLPPQTQQQQQQQRPRTLSQWSQDSRSEAWETGSVSTVASDYFGSESAYGGVGSFGGDDPSPSPYNGHRTHPASSSNNCGPVSNFSDVPPPESVALPGVSMSSGFLMDGSRLVPNRRRASTLSPRQGLGFLDEHHEVHHADNNIPVMPSFSSPLNNNNNSVNHHHRAYPPSRHTLGLVGGSPSNNVYVEPSRSRTSSAASLPAMSGGSDEFPAVTDQPSFRRIPSGISTLREDAPSPSVTGLADVFRGSPSPAYPCARAPPGLVGGTEPARASAPSGGLGLQQSSLGSDSLSDSSRGRAATWAGSTADNVFGPGLFGRQQLSGEGLSDDLAAILKLSVGSEESKEGSAMYPPPGL